MLSLIATGQPFPGQRAPDGGTPPHEMTPGHQRSPHRGTGLRPTTRRRGRIPISPATPSHTHEFRTMVDLLPDGTAGLDHVIPAIVGSLAGRSV